MIKVTIELWPLGFERYKKKIGEIDIWNDGSSPDGGTRSSKSGNYKFKLFKRGLQTVWKQGEVTGFPRLRLGPYDLLYRCLKEVLRGRNDSE